MVAAPSATPPPSWQVVGCEQGGKQPGFLSTWLQKPGIRFQCRLVGCEIEKSQPPSSLSWCCCLALPALGACLWALCSSGTPESSESSLLCLCSFYPALNLSWTPGLKAISNGLILYPDFHVALATKG